MSIFTAITTLATLLWCYALVLTVAWGRAVGRCDLREHVGHFVSLMGVFVPGMALVVGIVAVSALTGLGAILFLLALVFPGAVAVGLYLEVARLTEPDAATDGIRVALAVALAVAWVSWG